MTKCIKCGIKMGTNKGEMPPMNFFKQRYKLIIVHLEDQFESKGQVDLCNKCFPLNKDLSKLKPLIEKEAMKKLYTKVVLE